MNPINAYKFCPRCSEKLVQKKENLLKCLKCSFEFYINPSPCNAVIIENENQEIMLVKRKFNPQKGFWDLPGGFIDSHETLETSVKREIKEELGVEVNLKQIIGVYEGTYDFQDIINPVLVIVVSAQFIGGKITVSDDISGYKYFSKKDILKQKVAFPAIKTTLRDYLKIR